MAIFHVVTTRTGPRWDPSAPLEGQSDWIAHAAFMDDLVDDGFVLLGGPLDGDVRVILVVDAPSRESVEETLAADPWWESHLHLEAVEPWTIRLDGVTRR
jgi:hypothetical protein